MQMKYDEKSYNGLLEKIFLISPSVQDVGFAPDAYKPGLEGMRAFSERLGDPWKRFRCIHVAGTNGKGSVASMLASSLCKAAKPLTGGSAPRNALPGPAGPDTRPLRVGLYTSPHLTDFRERMKVITDRGWRMPTKRQVWDFFQKYDTSGLSFFEMTTGLAFWWFAKQKVDIAVIETGLGGLLDSTNIITPELCVITSIGLDHCALLGGTRAEIAVQKAGIFKSGIPAVVASEDDETAPVFRATAEALGCPLIFADSEPSSVDEAAILPRMDLQGPCQGQNLHTALTALKVLGYSPDIPAIEKTAKRTGLQGRWETLRKKPKVICDIGHNPPALQLNFSRLAAMGRNLIIVYGIMADKDLEGIAPLMPADAGYILVSPDTPRALPHHALFEKLSRLRPELSLREASGVAEGISLALSLAGPEDLIYIGGSTFVVTEAITYFDNLQ